MKFARPDHKQKPRAFKHKACNKLQMERTKG